MKNTRGAVFQDQLMSEGFTAMPNVVLTDSSLSVTAKMTYLLILHYAWQDDHAFPSQQVLCENMGVSANTVRKSLDELRTAGLLDWKQRGLNKTNIYIILSRLDAQIMIVPETQNLRIPYNNNKTHFNKTQAEPIIKEEEIRKEKKEEEIKENSHIPEVSSPPQTNPLEDWLEAKKLRKANKGKWRQTYQKTPQPSVSLADSLVDNLPPEEIEDMAKRLKVSKADVARKKEEYITWVNSEPNNQKRWGLDMKLKVETFVQRAIQDKQIEQHIPQAEIVQRWVEAGCPADFKL